MPRVAWKGWLVLILLAISSGSGQADPAKGAATDEVAPSQIPKETRESIELIVHAQHRLKATENAYQELAGTVDRIEQVLEQIMQPSVGSTSVSENLSKERATVSTLLARIDTEAQGSARMQGFASDVDQRLNRLIEGIDAILEAEGAGLQAQMASALLLQLRDGRPGNLEPLGAPTLTFGPDKRNEIPAVTPSSSGDGG